MVFNFWFRYLTTGDSFKSISYNYRIGHTTASVITHETCKAIVQTLMQEAMPLPIEEQWKAISAEFFQRTGFPNCIGAIDGKHIQIQAPANSGSLYFNYKKTFSTVLLALVDAQYNFIAVDVGSYGKNSDGGILAHSNLGEALENGTFRLPPDEPLPGTSVSAPYVIVGDEAFPLKRYLMRPFPGPQLTTDERSNFNYRLTIARRYVENAFGILSQKFRIFNRRIQSTPRPRRLYCDGDVYLTQFYPEKRGMRCTRYQSNTSIKHCTPESDRVRRRKCSASATF